MATANAQAKKKLMGNRQPHSGVPPWETACEAKGGCQYKAGDITGNCVLCQHPEWLKECGNNKTLRRVPKTCPTFSQSEVEDPLRKTA